MLFIFTKFSRSSYVLKYYIYLHPILYINICVNIYFVITKKIKQTKNKYICHRFKFHKINMLPIKSCLAENYFNCTYHANINIIVSRFQIYTTIA